MDNYFNVCLADDQIRAISSIGLAHLGDAVYELLVRSWLCAHGRATGKGLHRAAVELVKAPAQARRAERSCLSSPPESWPSLNGAETPTSIPSPITPAAAITSRPPPWSACWETSTSGGSKNASTNYLPS